MTHPHHDRAQAALHALRAARRQLHDLVAWHARNFELDAADGLRSPRYGGRHGSGGHSDPIADTLITGTKFHDRWEQLADRTTDTLHWLVTRLQAGGAGDPLGRLESALPTLSVGVVEHLLHWLTELDGRIRIALNLPLDGYGTAEDIAARLTTAARPIDAARIRDWARRSRSPGDPLHGLLPAIRTDGARTGTAWYWLADAQHVAGLTARAKARLDDQAA